MKKFLLVGSQLLAAFSFVSANAQVDPVGAAVLAVLGATALNLLLAFILTNKKFGGSGEFNGPFSAQKLGKFLEDDYAVKRVLVLAVALFGSYFTSGMAQQGLAALFVAGAATLVATITADNAGKFRALFTKVAPTPATPSA